METGPSKIRAHPPQVLVAIVEKLIPRHHREYILGDLFDRYVSPLRFIWEIVQAILILVPSQVRRSFGIRLLTAEACALALSFYGTSWSFVVGVGVGAALATCVLRDAYAFPSRSLPPDCVEDALVALTAMFLVQTVIGFVSPGMMLPLTVMIRSAAVALFTLSAVRMAFHCSDPQRRPAHDPYRKVLWIDIAFMIAGLAIVMTNPASVPSVVAHQDFLFVVLPIVTFGVAFRLQKSALGGACGETCISSLFADARRNELARKRDSLWGTLNSNTCHLVGAVGVELLSFAFLALPLGIVAVSWMTGYIEGSDMNWTLIGSNSTAFLALSVIWPHIRAINRKTAQLLQREIDTLDSGKEE